MKAYSILKIVDIEPCEFDNDFLIWLTDNIQPEFTDTDETFGEHIYSISGIEEQFCSISESPKSYESQIESLEAILHECEAGYFRIVN